jgi:hypothetical protein
VLKPEPGQSALIVEDGVLIFTGEAAGDLERAVQRDREERAKKLANCEGMNMKRGATRRQRPEG